MSLNLNYKLIKWFLKWNLLLIMTFFKHFEYTKLIQSCLTLCYPMNFSLPGSSVHRLLQVQILEWIAMPSFREYPKPRSNQSLLCVLHWQESSLPVAPPRFCIKIFLKIYIVKTVQQIQHYTSDLKRKNNIEYLLNYIHV